MGRCGQCGTALEGRFCHSCGAEAEAPRLTVRRIATDVLHDVTNLELPLIRTAVDLAIRPREVVRGYVAGRRGRYSNPVKFCIVGALAIHIALVIRGVHLADVYGVGDARAAGVLSFIQQYLNLLTLASLPAFAGVCVLLFRSWTFAEHMAFALFVYGEMYLFQACAALVGGYQNVWLISAHTFLVTAYSLWAGSRVYGQGLIGVLKLIGATAALWSATLAVQSAVLIAVVLMNR